MEKEFRIGIFEEQSGYVMIKAENEEKAKKIALERLEENGVEAFEDFDSTHREVYLV